MIENVPRIGNFTSSKISALMSDGRKKGEFGKPFYTYIEEKNMERRLGRSLTTEVSARATSWGKLVEGVAFTFLEEGYTLASQETIMHEKISCWAGSPDVWNETTSTVGDIKSPMTLKSFCTFADCKDIQEVREKHKDGEDYYWQLISNAILTGMKYGELIVYCPYQKELDTIREFAAKYDGEDQKKFEWISVWANDSDLPYLIEGRHYKNMYRFRFEIAQEDVEALTARVIEAEKMLVKFEDTNKVYAPTEEQKKEAQAKIAFMNALRKELKQFA